MIETDLPLDEEDTKTADRPTVLVIDDNADIRNYVKTLLAEEYHVLDAPEAATGIRLAMKYVPDVIISDVMMPGMDGMPEVENRIADLPHSRDSSYSMFT